MLTADSEDVSEGTSVLVYQAAGFMQYSIAAILVSRLRITKPMMGYDVFQIGIVTIIILSFCLQLHGEGNLILEGIAYTATLVVAILVLSTVWTMSADDQARCFAGGAIVYAAFAVGAVIAFGWPEGRHVGVIHPNFFGAVMLSGFIYSQFCEGLVMILSRVICFVLVASVSSRFAIIGCLAAFTVFELTFKPISARLVIMAAAAVGGAVLFHQQIAEVLALDDPARNLDSGFTGRESLWEFAVDSMESNAFGVGFKRPPPGEAGHNGYLKALLEFGIIGGGLIIFSVLGIIAVAIVKALQGAGGHGSDHRIASARAGGLVALAFACFFQPQMFNLGDVHGVSLILLLFAPERWQSSDESEGAALSEGTISTLERISDRFP
jgi:O-antigen ligase